MFPTDLPEKIDVHRVWSALQWYLFTPMGQEALEELHPSADSDTVERRNRESRQLLELHREGERLPFMQADEIKPWIDQSQIENGQLPREAFLQIRDHVRLARQLHSKLTRLSDQLGSLETARSELAPLRELENKLDRTFGPEGEILDSATPELKSIRSSLRSRRQQLRKRTEQLYREAMKRGAASDEGPTLRGGRMVLPIKAEQKRSMNGFIHDVSATGQTVYLEPVEVLEINNDLRELERKEAREVEKILQGLTALVGQNRSELLNNRWWIGQLDLLQAKAALAHQWKGVIPRRSAGKSWRLSQVRHPALLLTRKENRQEVSSEIVPLDLTLEAQEQGLLLSGPNAGGKSVVLKSVALSSWLYQCGIPLPVHPDTELPILTGIYLDMGDEQSVENDLSTFSSRLLWMRRTLEQLDEGGLVLVDEAGAGTDPDEGSALSQAFGEAVLDRGARLLLSTHHGALKQFGHQHPGLINCAMEFDQSTLAPTYRFRKGVPGSSFAFHIARRMELPDPVIERARTLLGDQKDRLSDLLHSLEETLQKHQSDILEAEKRHQAADEREKRYRQNLETLHNERDDILKEALEKADQIYRQANRNVERAVEEIRSKGTNAPDAISDIRKKLDQQKRSVRTSLQKRSRTNRSSDISTFSVGDPVTLAGGDQSGTIEAIDGTRVTVRSNGLTIKTDLSKLEQANASNKPAKNNRMDRFSASSGSGYRVESVSPTLSLRGLRADEATQRLMHHLDRALAAGLHRVEIIHGKGTGVLMERVRAYLDNRPDVTGWEEAPLEQGGSGCTIARLD
ncbi:MAG: endonuclease MutS2 [Balneolaceae bacterium]